MVRTYEELIQLPTFEERFNYLQLNGMVGESTFAFDRYLNQVFYKSSRWRSKRDEIIARDNCCEMGLEGYEIGDSDLIVIHHMNPIRKIDVINDSDYLLDSNYLIAVSTKLHKAIHYSDKNILMAYNIIERRPNDTIPWKL